VHGHTHSQVLPHILFFAVQSVAEAKTRDALVEVACTWVTAYRLRHRKGTSPDMTDADLPEITSSLALFAVAYKSSLAKVKYVGGEPNTQKFHKMAHATDVILRLGQLRHLSSNHFEHAHVVSKHAYAVTSKRHKTCHAEMVKVQRASAIAHARLKTVPQRANATAYLRASVSGEHELQSSGSRASWRVWQDLAATTPASTDTWPELAAKRLLALQPDLAHLPAALLDYYTTDQRPQPNAPPEIKVVSAACLAAHVPWLDRNTALQPVRASPSFCGGPWYSNVSVVGQDGETWYAQLRLIFTAGNVGLAFVRWYEEPLHRQPDVLTKHKCVPLVWAKPIPIPGRPQAQEWYQIIAVATIVARQYIVPNFAEGPGHFYVSPFKWDRQPADKSGFPPAVVPDAA
jgi:hypothetical protein